VVHFRRSIGRFSRIGGGQGGARIINRLREPIRSRKHRPEQFRTRRALSNGAANTGARLRCAAAEGGDGRKTCARGRESCSVPISLKKRFSVMQRDRWLAFGTPSSAERALSLTKSWPRPRLTMPVFLTTPTFSTSSGCPGPRAQNIHRRHAVPGSCDGDRLPPWFRWRRHFSRPYRRRGNNQ